MRHITIKRVGPINILFCSNELNAITLNPIHQAAHTSTCTASAAAGPESRLESRGASRLESIDASSTPLGFVLHMSRWT